MMGITRVKDNIGGDNHVFPLRYQDDIPHDVTDYAQSLVDKLFIHTEMFECEVEMVYVVDNSSRLYFHRKGCKFYKVNYLLRIRMNRLSMIFSGNNFTEKRRNVETFIHSVLKIPKTDSDHSPEGFVFDIDLDGYKEWKRDKQLGALLAQNDLLNDRVNELTTHVNQLTKLLETMWMHPNMPGGQEQVQKAVESYNQK